MWKYICKNILNVGIKKKKIDDWVKFYNYDYVKIYNNVCIKYENIK